MEYRIVEITEADFGCEERPEGAPALCGLVLKAYGGTGQSGCTEAAAPHSEQIYREVPEFLTDELGLVPGQILSEKELEQILAGKKPEG